jgi:hypothetical protein
MPPPLPPPPPPLLLLLLLTFFICHFIANGTTISYAAGDAL